MMALSGGRQRTTMEYQKLMEAAGFTLSQIIPTESVIGVSVIECRPAQTLDLAPEIGYYFRQANQPYTRRSEVIWLQQIVSVQNAAMES